MKIVKTNKQEIIDHFDPSEPATGDLDIFGLPFDEADSEIVILPAPWEATVSYGGGTSRGCFDVELASFQVDLNHQQFPELWKLGIHYDFDFGESWVLYGQQTRELAEELIETINDGADFSKDPEFQADLKAVNKASEKFNKAVYERSLHWLSKGKLLGLLGGDHSTPYGYYKAIAKHFGDFGILHLDAHMDLRIAYEGFTHSHASIMYNTLKLKEVKHLTQVGIRDFCEQEVEVAKKHHVKVFTDAEMKREAFRGKNWHTQCEEIIATLPQHVLISFDVDGLDPSNCPNTGTPVPGGFSFQEATYLLDMVVESGRKVIGFDLVEVAGSTETEWDANVGARLLFHLCGILAKANGRPVGTPVSFS